MPSKKSDRSNSTGSPLGFEAKLWLAADMLRNNMDAAEYKHVVLGLIFLKYISDCFEEHHAKLAADEGDYAGANPENPDEYSAENIFWVPPAARWSYLQRSAKQPTIGKIVDDGRDNPRLKGVLPKDSARLALDKHRPIGTNGLTAASKGEKTHRFVDRVGLVYDWSGAKKPATGSPNKERGGAHQYFLTRFAGTCGKEKARYLIRFINTKSFGAKTS